MKEITRIHLAKVAYDIELDAKRELERYLNALHTHTDEEVMNDIEARMVELLGERGIAAGGVVTTDDIDDLKTHLGEPKDFADDSNAEDQSSVNEAIPGEDKRLYRDMDNALLGGVCAGLAAYFGIEPVLVRIVFIGLALASFGWIFLIYPIMWFIVPPATTASQKLTMKGKPVTAASIKEFSEREFTNERLIAIRNFVSVAGGLMMLGVAALALFATFAVASNVAAVGTTEQLIGAGIVIIGGVLSMWFCIAMAQMLFRQDFSPRSGNKLAILFMMVLLCGVGFVVWRILLGT